MPEGFCLMCRFCDTRNEFNREVRTCHKNPPVVNNETYELWPLVGAKDWCGAFEARP